MRKPAGKHTAIKTGNSARRRQRLPPFNNLLVVLTVLLLGMVSPSSVGRFCRSSFSSSFTSSMLCSALSTVSMSTHKNHKLILPKRIAVIGGGASGIFAALAASEQTTTKNVEVTVYEATSQTLQKVKISGGGRCNVLHDTSKSTTTLLEGYPRGKKELQGLFLKYFTPTMARAWFEQRGVSLKTEDDGRMFPITDNSQTIIDTLLQSANQQGVNICSNQKVASVSVVVPTSTDQQQQQGGSFRLELKDGTRHLYHAIILATGSAPSGYVLAQQLELTLDPRVPSLFTLNAKTEVKEGGLLFGLSGISVPKARVTLPSSSPSPSSSQGEVIKSERSNKPKKKSYPMQEGPLLITHHGLSGPAVLRLSAFAAHEFKERNYRGQLLVNWDTTLGDNVESVLEDLWKCTVSNPKRAVASTCPLPNHSIPRRLWSALVLHSGFEQETLWGAASKKLVRQLATNLVACSIEITGKGTFKEEFVTAGGVSLKEIDMKKMESKIHPGLFVCGELLNVDGVTGGFNFMNCWSTGYVAGHAAVDHCLSLEHSPSSF